MRARLVTSPVAQLMKRSPVICLRRFESLYRGKLDVLKRGAVASAVTAMLDVSASVNDKLFGVSESLCKRERLRFYLRLNAIYLLGIEDPPQSAEGDGFKLASLLIFLFDEVKQNDRRTLLALAYLTALFLPSVVSTPAAIAVRLSHQDKTINAVVVLASRH